MGIFRSEQMKSGVLVLPHDRARELIDLIGSRAKMQIEDMNAKNMQRPYKRQIQRIDEMERIIRFLVEELSRLQEQEVVKYNVECFLENSHEYELDKVEGKLKQIYQDFIQFKENNTQLTTKRNAALEERYVLQTAIASMAVTQRAQARQPSLESDEFEHEASRTLLENEDGLTGRRPLETMFSNVAGVIPQEEQARFERTLFRATRGNTFTHFQQIFECMLDPKTGREVKKSVFVIYFQDNRSSGGASAMSEKIHRICASFGVNTYRWPASPESAEESRQALQAQVEDHDRLLKAHESIVGQEAKMLVDPARNGGNSLIEEWRQFCIKEKSIYATLNHFEAAEGQMNLRANCWYPAAEEDNTKRILAESRGQGHSSAILMVDRAPRRHPPTYIQKNEFTAVFQEMVDTYGLPRYEEANPALFTVVTFPFLFGVMYGDVGHGLMVTMVGAYAVWKADELKFSVPTLYYIRYMVLMMGLFAMYCGLLYNDVFSLGLDLFGSRWKLAGGTPGESISMTPMYDVKNEGGLGPYPFGIDPAWHGAKNELVYMNSMKMKVSVVLGVTQMCLGLLLRVSNTWHERNGVDFLFECIPMTVFMVCFFGFMDYMILYKWVTAMPSPPSIINSLICMGMWTEDPSAMLGEQLPRILMGLSMLSVPFMLIPKPLILRSRHQARAEEAERQARFAEAQERLRGGSGQTGIGSATSMGDEESGALVASPSHGCGCHGEEEEFEFGDVMIHQVIETIEYVLGTVSHTASYLRLWALSLAHQQLSLVFFGVLLSGLSMPFPLNVFSTYIAFAFWFAVTVGILCGMDTMECFLHTLRLHWIEFQSKFYKADGYAFEPFCHKSTQEKVED
jgi:V-type H+-transporting ATPase subunit a